MNRAISKIERPRPVSELVLERLRLDIIEMALFMSILFSAPA